MEQGLTKRPDGLSGLSSQVFGVLERYTRFPWPLLKTQAERHGFSPLSLDTAGLRVIAPDLAGAVARFTSPEKGQAVLRELLTLIR